MSGEATLKLCVLWESEIRAAAKAMRDADDLPDIGDERGHAMVNAYQLARVALFHVSDDTALCLLGSEAVKEKIDGVARIVRKRKPKE